MNVILINAKSQAFCCIVRHVRKFAKTTVSFVMSFLYNSYMSTWNKSAHPVRIFMKLVLRNISIIWPENTCLY